MRLPLPIPLPFTFPLTRFFGPGLTALGLLALGYLFVSGRLDLSRLTGALSDSVVLSAPSTADNSNAGPPTPKLENRISIATFNIQVFGKKKAADATVMADLAQICKMFDVVALQEVRSPEAEPVQKLVERMNADGSRYAFLLSSPIGRIASYTEQYAFVWDTTRIRLEPNRAYVMNDELDRLHREPFVASFRAIPTGQEARQPFTLTLINMHTDPDEVTSGAQGENELDVLADVFVNVRNWESGRYGEDDIILLGDLNASSTNLSGLSRIPGLVSLTAGQPTNTVGTKELDHILIDSTMTGEFTRQVAVIDYQRDLGFTAEQSAAISDHRPVCAQFSAFEVPPYDPSVAAAPATTVAR